MCVIHAPLQTRFLSQVLHDAHDIAPYVDAHTMDATDLDACKRVCVDRRIGAFVVVAGVAYFTECNAGLALAHLRRSVTERATEAFVLIARSCSMQSRVPRSTSSTRTGERASA